MIRPLPQKSVLRIGLPGEPFLPLRSTQPAYPNRPWGRKSTNGSCHSFRGERAYATTWTVVPTGMISKSSLESASRIRTQPCDAYPPMEFSAYVPWILMPGASRYSAWVPRGLPGPGPNTAGSPAPHPLGAGLTQVGLSR
jgi:hypothetical protein